MTKVSTYGLGGLGVSFFKDEIAGGNRGFNTKGLEGALGTEVARGTFPIDAGSIVFDSSPVFIADSGLLTASPNIETSAPTLPSTRPYIWKYR